MWRRPLEILYRFALLGISCFGGPTAHIGVFHTTFVKSLKWVTAEEFAHDNTLCQLIPGPASSQLGMLIGARRGGIIGSLCAWVGFTTPSAVLMYLAATNLPWMSAQSSAGAGLLVGAAVTVCAAVWGMINPIRTSRPALLLCCLSGLAMLISPGVLTQFVVLALCALVATQHPAFATTVPTAHPVVQLPPHGRWFLVVAGLLLVVSWLMPSVYSTLYQTGALVFGGGHVVLPMLLARFPAAQESIVQGYALAQLVPGPLFTLATFIGASQSPTPVLGAIGATFAMFVPGWLIVCGVHAWWSRQATHPLIGRAIKGTHAAVVGMLAASALQLVVTHVFDATLHALIALVCVVLLTRTKLPPWLLPLGCAVTTALFALP